MYRTHRSTAARRIRRAREELLSSTRKKLGERLKIRPAEVDSLMRPMGSNLEVSLLRFLGKEASAAEEPRGDGKSSSE